MWIDAAPTPENVAFAGARFAFDPLAVEDAALADIRALVDALTGEIEVASVLALPAAPLLFFRRKRMP